MVTKTNEELWIKMVDILENNFPKLNIDDVRKPSSNNRSQAMVMLSELKILFNAHESSLKERLIEEIDAKIKVAEFSYKTAVSDQVAPCRNALEELLDLKDKFILSIKEGKI